MKKSLKLGAALFLTLLCSCSGAKTVADNTATQIYFDTAVTLTADCSDEVLSAAFSLCEKYEKTLSRMREDSEVSLINSGKNTAGKDTFEVIEKGLYYGMLTGGKFDITVADLTSLWDFKNETVPSRDEIAEALKNVDYESIEISDGTINTNGKKIDLGGIAKGYVSDKLLEFFKSEGIKKGIINLGGNVTVFGDKFYKIGIKKPFGDGDIFAKLGLKNMSVSTSGTYERYFEKDGTLYHHILDTKTGYPVKTDLLSASVIGDTSADCDALSTVCILYGLQKATELINETNGFEAVFIDENYQLSFTDGLEIKDGIIVLKTDL